jgi:hypothetical protein
MGLAFQATPAHLRWAYVLSSLIEEPSFFFEITNIFRYNLHVGGQGRFCKEFGCGLVIVGCIKSNRIGVQKKKQSH